MYLQHLNLYQFRNYTDEKIELQPAVNLLVGPNAHGKTNALEGIYYLLTGKSYRAKLERELIAWGKSNFYLRGVTRRTDRKILLESYYELGKKVMKIDQIACQRLSDYVGTVNAVFFSPDDLNIVKDSPQQRRKFLDLLIAQVRPSHISYLNNYQKIIKQKNILLKKGLSNTSLKIQLQAWNEQLLIYGSKIIENRSSMADQLKSKIHPIFQQIFSDQDHLDLNYLTLGKRDAEEALTIFSELLDKKMSQEIEQRAVLVGPHRDDLLINLNQRAAQNYASQGQQRGIVLCLKLGEMEIILKEKGHYPILLLDDVLSELDEYRRQYLLEYIQSTKVQSIISMTDAEERFIRNNTVVFQVYQGKIRRKQ